MAPVRRCNNVLNRLSGAARAEFLFKGTTLSLDNAYSVHTKVEELDGSQLHMGTVWVPVRIKCQPLSRTPWRTTLRIEPANIQQVGKFLCPMELKLYGRVDSHRKFDGEALFAGTHYLSALTPLSSASTRPTSASVADREALWGRVRFTSNSGRSEAGKNWCW